MTLDELVLEWSYRTRKGYPKLDDPSDILILKSLLKELKMPVEDILRELESEDEEVDGMEDSPDGKINIPTSGDVSLDEVIEFHLEKNGLWEGSIPKPKGNSKSGL